MQQIAQYPAFFGSIPSGDRGVRATLNLMVNRCRKFLRPKSGSMNDAQRLLKIRRCAQELTFPVPEKDYWGEIEALQIFVRDEIRYTHDMLDAETVQDPDYTLDVRSGDCDDKSILFACLANCIGYPTRFCAIAMPSDADPLGQNFSHVSGQALIDQCGWVNAECIPVDEMGTKVDLGWFPPQATRCMLAYV